MLESREQRQARAAKMLVDLRLATKGMERLASHKIIARYGRNPFLILISCLLSLRTRDNVSYAASCRLFEVAKTPQQILNLSFKMIESLIYPVGFYRVRAVSLHEVCQQIIDRFGGMVPDNQKDLLSIKGIGLKTANLVLSEAFGHAAICVDTHVHRISNRHGLVDTKTPDQTETALREIIPPENLHEFGSLLVQWGQNECRPQRPAGKCCVLSTV